MSRIKVMDQALANLIAAGEVIERPASVVKELVENSLDAGAKHISIEIERAGSRLIAITDDGCGMDEKDAHTALELHGTSKLSCAEDISTVLTMGFRGEALPSVARVSRLTLRTREKGAEEGTEINVEGGKILNSMPCGAPAGTSIRVENLFFNTPARKKFMKSAATEEHHIEEAVTLLALANPQTGFELTIDGRSVFNLPKSSLPDRMRELFGRRTCAEFIEVEHREGELKISGFIGAPGITRSSRREQRFFVNRRPVDSAAIGRALRDGYGTLAEPGRYPPALLFLELPVEDIDVNVHPAKREIRFRSEFAIIRAIAAATGNSLRNWGAGNADAEDEETAVPEIMDIPPENVYDIPVRKTNKAEVPHIPAEKTEKDFSYLLESAGVNYHVEEPQDQPEFEFERKYSPSLADTPLVPFSQMPEKQAPVDHAAEKRGFWPERILGIYDNTYLLAAGDGGLLLIDQHAAHERIMFERLLDSWKNNREVPAQGLLIPETLELPRGLLTLLMRNLDFFMQLGFDFTPAGGLAVIVNALPVNLKTRRPLGELISDMLNGLLDENYTPGDLESVARAACHAAVKAHDELTVAGAEQLLKDLRKCRQGTLCPHGRPTMITLSMREIEKRFGRR